MIVPRYYTVKEAAAALQVAPDLIYSLMDRGEIPNVYIGKYRRIPIKLFDLWLEARDREAEASVKRGPLGVAR